MNETSQNTHPREHDLPPWDSEYSLPAWTAEFSEPSLRGEHAPAPPEGLSPEAPDGEARTGKMKRLRKLFRNLAAAAVMSGIVLTVAPKPLEVVDVDSYIEIECCAVTPEKPEVLHFRYMDYRSVYEDVPTYSADSFQFFLVSPDGQETELTLWRDPVLYRPVYCPEDEPVQEAAYSSQETEGTYFNLNTGCEMWCADIGPYEPGSSLKIVCAYESEGVIRRMTSTRRIVQMQALLEPSASAEITPNRGGIDQVYFQGTLHPAEDDDYEYVFGDLAFSRMSFCTRWYDDQGVFLGEGWCFAVPSDVDWPFPDVYLAQNDYVFLYQGPVRRTAADPAAAYYSLELMIIEESTGWPYLLETELFPVRIPDEAIPTPTPVPTATPAPTAAPPQTRELVIESGKDGFDFIFRLADTDWVLSEDNSSVVIGSPTGRESMMLYSVEVGSAFTSEDLDSLLLYRYQQEAASNESAGIATGLVSTEPYACPVNGYTGRVLDFEMDTGEQRFLCRYVFWGVDTRLYGLTLLSYEDDYEHTCTVLEELLSSFTPAS